VSRVKGELHAFAGSGLNFHWALLLESWGSRLRWPRTSAPAELLSPSGFYRVAQDLTASAGACMEVSAARTIVFLNDHHLSGAGSGVGVSFFPRAAHSFLAGGNATINGFAIAVEDDASNVRGDNFNANGNAVGGILVNGAQGSTFSNFQASNNGSYGVHFLMGTSVAEDAQASGHGNYGIRLDGAREVRTDNFDTEHNAIAGRLHRMREQWPRRFLLRQHADRIRESDLRRFRR